MFSQMDCYCYRDRNIHVCVFDSRTLFKIYTAIHTLKIYKQYIPANTLVLIPSAASALMRHFIKMIQICTWLFPSKVALHLLSHPASLATLPAILCRQGDSSLRGATSLHDNTHLQFCEYIKGNLGSAS